MTTDTLSLPVAGPSGSIVSSVSTAGGSGNESDDDRQTAMGYQQTLMYGRYSKALGDYAREEAKRQKILDKQRKRRLHKEREEMTGEKRRGKAYRTTSKVITYVWKHTFAKLGEDWVFLAVLGIVMAIISYIMDYGIGVCGSSRMKLYNVVKEQNYHVVVQFLAWCILPVFLVLFSAGFVHIVAPQAIGSGIPEMKTIMRGVVLKEYLTVKTGIAKMVGLTCTLGSGMPLGKEGPFVHIASIVATCLTKMVTTFQGIYTNESRHSEMLAAACAVGVACCFASPIGGVLFSIEVTSVFFAVRNYWRGFFAAICGATCFRLLFVFASGGHDTITAIFRTDFKVVYPYDPRELIAFAGIGVVCGIGGALYVYIHRRYVLWMRANKRLTKFLQKNRFIYPFIISFMITALTFPDLLGQFTASKLNTHDQIHDLFSNHSWTDESTISSGHQAQMLDNWTTPYTGVFSNLLIYIFATFWLSIFAATLPVPTGVLVPAFKIGAAFGRIVGEGMNMWFPGGFGYDDGFRHHIVAGGYATVGAASFTGAVTHTISISVIVFEMTGQITHIIPILISVLISNAIAALLQPSCYDSIIMIKKLPYLPNILPSNSKAYNVFVDDFMLREIKYIWYGMRYLDLRQVLKEGKKLRAFPLVDAPDSMILLGSVQRTELIAAIEQLIGKQRRLKVSMQRYGAKLKQQQLDEQRKIQQKIDERAKKEAEEKARLEQEAKQKALTLDVAGPATKTRRPSRFEVVTVATPSAEPSTSTPKVEQAENAEKSGSLEAAVDQPRRPSFLDSMGIDPDSPAMKALIQLSTKPKKGILKKSNSYTIHSFGLPGLSSPGSSSKMPAFTDESSWKKRFQDNRNYRTVTGAENPKWKNALDNLGSLFKKPSNNSMHDKTAEILAMSAAPVTGRDVTDFMYQGQDMTLEEQHEWEEEEMLKVVDFDSCQIDPAPFQLVEKTSLLKVHNLFSMVGVNHAYVTQVGRLIGVVGLKELRAGIENANSGQTANAPPVVEEKPARKASVVDVEAADDKSNENALTTDDETDYSDSEMLPGQRADNGEEEEKSSTSNTDVGDSSTSKMRNRRRQNSL